MRVISENTVDWKMGAPEPLGATAAGAFVNFAVSVPGASEVTLLVYRGGAAEPEYAVVMEAADRYGSVFSVSLKLPAETPEGGWQYEYETKGERFTDPYARLVAGRERFGKRLTAAASRLVRGVVRTQTYRWNGEERPHIPMSDLILYKLHVRGFTKELKTATAGTYAGLAGKAEYLANLGVNAVLLMPFAEYNECFTEGDRTEGVPTFSSTRFYHGSMPRIPEEISEAVREHKVNYWGYAKHYFLFAPKASYAHVPGAADMELRQTVKKLHNAGIEVLAEGARVPPGRVPDHRSAGGHGDACGGPVPCGRQIPLRRLGHGSGLPHDRRAGDPAFGGVQRWFPGGRAEVLKGR